MNREIILKELKLNKNFDRTILLDVIRKQNEDFSKNSLNWILDQLLIEGSVMRIARNKYEVVDNSRRTKRIYKPLESDKLKCIEKFIQEKYPLVDFCIWETVQLNEFLNHQIAHNTIVVEVENMIENAVYSTLREEFDKNVLLKPNSKELMYYREDDTIVVMKLISEAPVNRKEFHSNTIEKLLVDLETNKFLMSAFSSSEYEQIYDDIFTKYIVDESKLFRYAKRRNAGEKIKRRKEEFYNNNLWQTKE